MFLTECLWFTSGGGTNGPVGHQLVIKWGHFSLALSTGQERTPLSGFPQWIHCCTKNRYDVTIYRRKIAQVASKCFTGTILPSQTCKYLQVNVKNKLKSEKEIFRLPPIWPRTGEEGRPKGCLGIARPWEFSLGRSQLIAHFRLQTKPGKHEIDISQSRTWGAKT